MVIKYGKIITCDTNSVQLIHCLLSMIISIDGGTPGEVTLSGSALLARDRSANGKSCRSGCLIHNGTYLTLSLTLTITLALLTLTVTVRVTLTLLTLILDTVVNKAPTSAG